MDLNLAAVIFMGGYVVVIIVAGLFMLLRPGGAAVRFSPGAATSGPTREREEILLGGTAEVFGNVRGRVEAVRVQPATRRLQALEVITGFGMDGREIPAGAILSADGQVVRLADSWGEGEADGTSADGAVLRRGAAVLSREGKRLGRLQLVCFDRESGTVTDLVVAGRTDPARRRVPAARLTEVRPHALVTDLTAEQWASLAPFQTDWEIRQSVMDRLSADPSLQPFTRSFTAEVQDQQVRLRGYLPNRALAERASALTKAVPGVLQVDWAIVTDDELAQAVTDAIRQDPSTASARVQVSARSGITDITGEVADRSMARNIERLASRVPGVQAVHNMVVIARRAATTP